MAFINIITRSFTHGFKNDIYNLYSGLNIGGSSCTNIILALCLKSFNHYLVRNNNFSI